ncbi:IscS subfamily cysteine desulfurase [uncultured Castellaniella sp.]|uniref:IscS subfamily cysteine desulfurase n=1 Tax=uncultured Castellaniella sp. TaxID=647907 RepID=UPI0026363A45|nr:IscS subfamily cysteine desulfurase [uncultured Castellaniella sp.]
MSQGLSPDLPIYLDYSATTPVDERVVQAMLPWLAQRFGNPASRSHAWGWDAEEAVDQARAQVAGLIHADSREIVWTSGATESDNLAIKGVAEFHAARGRHIVTARTEHKAVLDTCQALEQRGFQVSYLDVDEGGLIDPQVLRAALRPDTILASIMLVNNEIGVIQDIAALAAVCREQGVLFHTDAAQATGKVDIDVDALGVDLMSLSAHKTYGPKGVGALYVRRKPRARLEAQIHGGGHERGLRSGTLPTHQIVGMGQAYALAAELMNDEIPRIRALRDRLWDGLKDLPDIYLNGAPDRRVAHTLNVSIAHIEGEALLMSIPELAVSSGSACTSASLEPSYVLRALGRSDPLAHSSLRLTLGRYTTPEQIDRAVALLRAQIQRLRDVSPLWEMRQQGTLAAWEGAL